VVQVEVVHRLGLELLHDPWYNKGSAFPMSERERLGLRGLLPPKVTSMQQQVSASGTARPAAAQGHQHAAAGERLWACAAGCRPRSPACSSR